MSREYELSVVGVGLPSLEQPDSFLDQYGMKAEVQFIHNERAAKVEGIECVDEQTEPGPGSQALLLEWQRGTAHSASMDQLKNLAAILESLKHVLNLCILLRRRQVRWKRMRYGSAQRIQLLGFPLEPLDSRLSDA